MTQIRDILDDLSINLPHPPHTHRPPSPMMDSVREKFTDNAKLAEDMSFAFQGCELADVMFIVGMLAVDVCGREITVLWQCAYLWGFWQLTMCELDNY